MTRRIKRDRCTISKMGCFHIRTCPILLSDFDRIIVIAIYINHCIPHDWELIYGFWFWLWFSFTSTNRCHYYHCQHSNDKSVPFQSTTFY